MFSFRSSGKIESGPGITGFRCLFRVWIFLFSAFCLAHSAFATEPAQEPGPQGTAGHVGGTSSLAGGTVVVTDSTGAVIATGTTHAQNGKYRIKLPPNTKGNITVTITKGADTDTGGVKITSLNPPNVTTTTVATISPGSFANAFRTSFALSGQFTALDTAVDYDSLSPTYGDVSGVVLASTFDVTGTDLTGTLPGTLALTLAGDQPFTLNLADVWAASDFVGTSADIDLAIAGIVTFNGLSSLFTGTVIGKETFLGQGIDEFSFTFDLTTADFGSVSGTLGAIGTESWNIPEPSSWLLFGIGLFALRGYRRARTKPSSNQGWMFPCMTSVLVLLFSPALALAVAVTGDTTMGFRAGGGTQATYTLFAFSEVTANPQNPQKTQNQNSYDALTGQEDAVLTFQQAKNIVLFDFSKLGSFKSAGPVPQAFSGDPQKPLVQINTKNDSFVPSLSPGDQDKTRLAGIDIVESSTSTNDFKQAFGRAVIYTGGVNPQLIPVIGAAGSKDKGVTGRGAGAAFDPFELAYSSSPYPYQVIINASLQLDDPTDSGGVVFFAVDSRNTDPNTFYADGQPFDEAVWFLHISANGPLASLSDLADPAKFQIDFQINDSIILNALDGNGNPISDKLIENAIRGNFTLADGTATLNSYPLFPYQMDPKLPSQPGLAGKTTYNVDQVGVTYGQGVNAGVRSVPEPPGLALLSLGLVVIAYRKRARVFPRVNFPVMTMARTCGTG